MRLVESICYALIEYQNLKKKKRRDYNIEKSFINNYEEIQIRPI